MTMVNKVRFVSYLYHGYANIAIPVRGIRSKLLNELPSLVHTIMCVLCLRCYRQEARDNILQRV